MVQSDHFGVFILLVVSRVVTDVAPSAAITVYEG